MNPAFLKPNLDGIPGELKGRNQYVLWRSEVRDGKPTKVPYSSNGQKAKSNDPATWVSFPQAVKALNNGGNYDGLGFVLSSEDSFTGIDLDKCRNTETGDIESWALNIIKGINSYTEVSPSGTGIRIFVRDAKLPESGRKKGPIEIYESGRYLTLTGHHVEGTPITVEARQDEVLKLHKKVFDQKPQEAPRQEQTRERIVSDDDLLKKMFSAHNGDKVRDLFNGNFSGYPSQSEADLALCSSLAFWTDRDPSVMDRLFRQSGLLREKWDKKHYSGGKTYGEETIRRACDGTRETYRGMISSEVSKETQKETLETKQELTAGTEEKKRIYTFKDAILAAGSFINLTAEARRTYIHPWFKEKSLIEIVAPRGLGKTWCGMSATIGACTGMGFGPWGGGDIVRGLYLDAEMTTQDVIDRLKMLRMPKDIPLFIYSNDFAHTLGIPPAHLGNPEWRKKFKEMLLEQSVELVVLDNIASLTPGIDENSKQEWDVINQYLLDLRRSGLSVIFLHHSGKSGTQRGTSGREDNLDIVIELKHPQGYVPEDGCRYIMHFSKHRLPQNELPLISDTEFKLIPEGNHYTWSWGDVKKEVRRECLRLLADGNDQKTICAILGVTKGYVSKMKTSFINKGFLSTKGEILPPGELFLGPKQETLEETL